jgi:hypothetical protein
MEGIKRVEESSISLNRHFIILAINLIYTQVSSFQKLCKVLTLPHKPWDQVFRAAGNGPL